LNDTRAPSNDGASPMLDVLGKYADLTGFLAVGSGRGAAF
jgi:hypothetical protein